jgi:6-pyruvoyl-tetrahydropterin synthase
MRVTRRYRFAASHRLHSGVLRARIGAVWQVQQSLWPRPRLRLDVTAAGPVERGSGQGGAHSDAGSAGREQVLKDFDHRYLNADLPEFKTLVPTSENIIRVIEDRLTRAGRRCFPANGRGWKDIRLQETKRNRFEAKIMKTTKIRSESDAAEAGRRIHCRSDAEAAGEDREDPERPGLARTPKRADKALRFLTSGYETDVQSIVNGALFSEKCDEMVVVKDIEFYSMCEHHCCRSSAPCTWPICRRIK